MSKQSYAYKEFKKRTSFSDEAIDFFIKNLEIDKPQYVYFFNFAQLLHDFVEVDEETFKDQFVGFRHWRLPNSIVVAKHIAEMET